MNGPLAAFPPLYGVGLGGLSIKRGSAAEALRSLTIEESPRFMRGVLQKGVLLHVGIRGVATSQSVDQDRLERFVGKYLGANTKSWNDWFVQNIVAPLDVMVVIETQSIVAKDVSFFKTGPNLASKM